MLKVTNWLSHSSTSMPPELRSHPIPFVPNDVSNITNRVLLTGTKAKGNFEPGVVRWPATFPRGGGHVWRWHWNHSDHASMAPLGPSAKPRLSGKTMSYFDLNKKPLFFLFTQKGFQILLSESPSWAFWFPYRRA